MLFVALERAFSKYLVEFRLNLPICSIQPLDFRTFLLGTLNGDSNLLNRGILLKYVDSDLLIRSILILLLELRLTLHDRLLHLLR